MESFVDVTYHGLEVARRAKLIEVAPDAGTVEVAAPMPVGTQLVLAIEGGISIHAVVGGVHEQVAGSDRAPGMRVKPALDSDAASRWWAERVTVASAVVTPTRPPLEMTAEEGAAVRAIADRAQVVSGAPPFADPARNTRSLESGEIRAAVLAAAAEDERLAIPAKSQPEARVTPADGIPAALADEDGLIDDGKRTEVMAAVDPEILARLTGSGEMPLIDDGKRTTLMDVPPVMDDDDGDDTDDDSSNGNGSPSPSASGQLPLQARGKRKRRRR